jgi:ribulose-bisphosphate carboxylase large chain
MAEPDQPLRVTYELACTPGEEPEAKARDIALEQTVELPGGAFPAPVGERVVGRIENLMPLPDRRWAAQIAYDPAAVTDDVPQLLNVLFGNISLKQGVRIAMIDWPASLLDRLPGPQLGVEGLRALCGVRERRPLLCAALKPVGFTASELADLGYRFALGGVDVIKDDHGLTDQATAPFAERVARCQEAVTRANRETGGGSLYFPNLTCGFDALERRLEIVRRAGCRGALFSPMLAGLDTLRWLAERSGLALLAHPAFTGAFFAPEHGMAPEALLGDLFRLLGSDGVIYPNAGGRFPFPEATCLAINDHLTRLLGRVRPSMPVPGGGIDLARVPYWIDRYGPDMMLLIGGSFYLQPDVRQAAARLLERIREQCS